MSAWPGEITSSLAARLATATGGIHGRILAVFDWLADWVRSPAFHGCLFIKAASEYPESGERPRQAAEAFKAGCRGSARRCLSASPTPGVAHQQACSSAFMAHLQRG